MGKITFGAGFAVGYVLGARAGRERYDQIVQAWQGFAGNPKVQEKAGQLQATATEAASSAAHKAGDLGSKAASKVGDKLPGRGSEDTGAVGEAYVTTDTGVVTGDTPASPAAPAAPATPPTTNGRTGAW